MYDRSSPPTGAILLFCRSQNNIYENTVPWSSVVSVMDKYSVANYILFFPFMESIFRKYGPTSIRKLWSLSYEISDGAYGTIKIFVFIYVSTCKYMYVYFTEWNEIFICVQEFIRLSLEGRIWRKHSQEIRVLKERVYSY